MDEKYLELADSITTLMIERGVAASRVSQKRPEGFDGYCECGEEIPQLRVEAGYYNCVRCQSQKEQRGKLFAGG